MPDAALRRVDNFDDAEGTWDLSCQLGPANNRAFRWRTMDFVIWRQFIPYSFFISQPWG